MSHRVLAIDVGTHAARAAIVEMGRVVLSEVVPVALHRIDQVRVEQDPTEILAATQSAVRNVLAQAAKAGLEPHRAALATQRSTVLAWNRHTGQALSPALSWQDTRAADQLAKLREHEQDIKRRSGLALSPHYGASKLRWLLSQDPALEPADACLGPLVSYLLFHLLNDSPCVCDESNAARTQLWNLRERRWDKTLCRLFGVPQVFLPALRPIQHNYGKLRESGLPLAAVCGDQNAAFFAFAATGEKGKSMRALVNAGSGAFVLADCASGKDTEDSGKDTEDKLLVSLYRSDQRTMDLLVEGTVNGAGTALDWFYSRAIAGTGTSQQVFYNVLPSWLAAVKQPPLFINSIGGLGSP